MDGFILGIAFVKPNRAEIFQCIVKLGIEVLPFAHAEIRKKMFAAEFPALVLGAQGFPLVVDRVPNVKQREEIGSGIIETPVGGHGCILFVQRSLAGILNAETGGNDEELACGM